MLHVLICINYQLIIICKFSFWDNVKYNFVCVISKRPYSCCNLYTAIIGIKTINIIDYRIYSIIIGISKQTDRFIINKLKIVIIIF